MTYSEKLKDPRWQKKRLSILNRDNFMCQHCKSTEDTLHVHHLAYVGEPWETPDRLLITLCKDCHFSEEEYLQWGTRGLIDALRHQGFTGKKFEWLMNVFLKSENRWGEGINPFNILLQCINDNEIWEFASQKYDYSKK